MLLFLALVSSASCLELVVQTGLGEVRGWPGDGGEYAMFLGVPYGRVDEERPFGPPLPHPPYSAPVEAYNNIICPQFDSSSGESYGSLQCLLLNIFVPEVPAGEKLPVMVWIHGGGWVYGDGTRVLYSPPFLTQKGVIVVNLQYRVGIYGFLCTDDDKAPGNAGLRDQLLGLRWIKEHIESFGGDPERITVFGESAGGMSVHLHILSSHEQLFNRAIIQSGAASSPWTIVPQHNYVPLALAAELGYNTEELGDAIDFLSGANVDDVVRIGAELRFAMAVDYNQPVTKACVERHFDDVEPFISTHPDYTHSDKARNMDIIIGYTSEEMLFQYGGRDQEFYDNFSFLDLLTYGFNITGLESMEEKIKKFYIGDKETSSSLEMEINNFGSDLVWNHPAERAVKMFLKDGVRSLYKYVFSYEGGRNWMKERISTSLPGASHGDELGYIFDMEMYRHQQLTEDDSRVIDQITTLWTNFAKYGEPTPQPSELLPLQWPAILPTSPQYYLDIDQTLSVSSRPYNDRMAFWDVFYEANEQQANGFVGTHILSSFVLIYICLLSF